MMEENKSSRKPFVQDVYDIVVDYSGYSSLAGMIFVFMPDLPTIGRVIMHQESILPNFVFLCFPIFNDKLECL